MAYDETTATPGEKRAVLLLAKMYDGGERSVNCEELSELLGTRAGEFETLLRHMSQANLIRHQSGEGFSLTAMIMDAADRINAAPSLDILDGLQKLAGRRKALLLLFLLFGAACCLLLLAARNALREVPAAPRALRPAARAIDPQPVLQVSFHDAPGEFIAPQQDKMSYHEELVKRLMTSGEWDQLTTQWRENFNKLDDQTAGALMAWQDEEHANSSVAKQGTPEGRQAAEELFLTSFCTLAEVFGGKLIHSDGGLTKLTRLGRALGNFLREAEKVGCSIPEFENQLVNLTTGCLTIVKALHAPLKGNGNE